MPQFYDSSPLSPAQRQAPKNETIKTKPVKARSAAGQALKFAFMPDIGRSLSSVKFAWYMLIALVAQLFAMARLIRPNHPCLDIRNGGKYKLLHIIRLAGKRVRWDRKHLHQSLMFVAITGSLVCLVLGICGTMMGLIVGTPAHAQITLTGMDKSAIDNIFMSQTNLGSLGAAVKIYNNFILVIAGIMFLYIVLTTVANTANSGTPFGKNFNHTWAPVRIIVALGLLIPLSSGFNSAQLILKELLKFGSVTASKVFEAYIDNTHQINFPDLSSLGQTNTFNAQKLVDVNIKYYKGIQTNQWHGTPLPPKPIYVENSSKTQTTIIYPGPNYNSDNNDIIGSLPINHSQGLELVDQDGKLINGAWSTNPTQRFEQARFRAMIDAQNKVAQKAATYVLEQAQGKNPDLQQIYADAINQVQKEYNDRTNIMVKQAMDGQSDQASEELNSNLKEMGWPGAAIWFSANYKKANDFASTAIRAQDVIDLSKDKNSQNVGITNQVSAEQDKDLQDTLNNEKYAANQFAQNPWEAFKGLAQPGFDAAVIGTLVTIKAGPLVGVLGGALSLGMSCLANAFGPSNSQNFVNALANSPIGYLATIGGLSATVAKAILAAGGIFALMNDKADAVPMLLFILPIVFGMFSLFAMCSFTLSFLLPILPAFRFMGGVLGWLLLAFIAFMAMPLFALAMLRTDGDSFMAQSAQSGFLMILSLVLRPILMILGFIGGLLMFNAIISITAKLIVPIMVQTMLSTYDPLAYGIFLFMFATFVIAMANSCFKMVDMVPEQAMAYIGGQAMRAGTEDDAQQAILGSAGSMYKGVSQLGQIVNSQNAAQLQKSLEEQRAKKGEIGLGTSESQNLPGSTAGEGGGDGMTIHEGGADNQINTDLSSTNNNQPKSEPGGKKGFGDNYVATSSGVLRPPVNSKPASSYHVSSAEAKGVSDALAGSGKDIKYPSRGRIL